MTTPSRVMSEHDQRVIHSSEDPNWRTPLPCFAALDREFHFQADLAATAESTLVSGAWLGPGGWKNDALLSDWSFIKSPQFLNPPFSRRLAARLKKAGDPSHAWYRIENWARKCWLESQAGCTIVGLFPFAPQTDWYRTYVMGHDPFQGKARDVPVFHAAREERRLPHRLSFLRADGSPAANAGVNTAIIVWKPNPGIVGPWQPHSYYWSFR